MSKVIQRFVSPSGTDAPANGRGAGSKPLKSIAEALKQVREEMKKDPSALGEVLLGAGDYPETLMLTSRLTLKQDTLNGPQTSLPRLVRPPSASPQGTASTTKPSGESIVTINGENIGMQNVVIDGKGGDLRGIEINNSKTIKIVSCTVRNCHTSVWAHNKEAGTLKDPYREPPLRTGTGGGVVVKKSQDIEFGGCTFEDNSTKQAYKQQLWDSQIDRAMKNLSFLERAGLEAKGGRKLLSRPEALRNGGGHVALDFASGVKFSSCTFRRGSAGGRGGAIQLGEKAYADIEDCLFDANRSFVDGGAICVNDPDVFKFDRKTINVRRCKFTNNVSYDDGGGIYMTSKTLANIDACEFRGNKAGANGGGLRISFGSSINVKGSIFEKNEANTDGGTKTERNQDGGGGIACSTASVTVESSRIEGNTCHGFAGGGLYYVIAPYNEHAEILAKAANGKTFGDILKLDYKFTKANLTLRGVSIAGNKAVGKTCYADECDIASGDGMQAGGAGGAVYALGAPKWGIPVSVVVDGVNFKDNKGGHRSKEQQSEFVFRDVEQVKIANDKGSKHAENEYFYSLFSVVSIDTSSSISFKSAEASGLVYKD